MNIVTASDLLAVSHGLAIGGDCQCFYCGSACEGGNARNIPVTFTDWPFVACPQSPWICHGCVLSQRERVTFEGYDKPQRMRTWSWFLTAREARRMSKADLVAMRAICLDPPSEPWALAISTSSQKHTIYRTLANVQPCRELMVQLETERVYFTPSRLRGRLDLCMQIAAASGKPSLSESLGVRQAISLAAHFGDERGVNVAEEWNQCSGEPLSRLAAFICPNMEGSRNVYPCFDPAA